VSVVAKLASAPDWPMEIADRLERIAAQLRSGEVVADQGVLVLRNVQGGLMHTPHRLGMPSSPVEVIGMLSYGSLAVYEAEGGE
jgi:hypothetical protein